MCGYFCLAFIDLCLLVRRYWILLTCFHRMILKRMMKLLLKCVNEINPSPKPGAGLENILGKAFLNFVARYACTQKQAIINKQRAI